MTRALWLRRGLVGLISVAAAVGAWQASRESLALAAAKQALGERDAAAARAALRIQPLDAPALRDLALARGGTGAGMVGGVTGDAARANLSLLKLADRVSRRDYGTQLLLLEANAAAGDVPATLRHYDVLLAGVPGSSADLFKVLVPALALPEVQAGVLAYRDRAWFVGLVEAVAAQPAEAEPGAAGLALTLARQAGLLAKPEPRDRLAPRLITALVAAGQTEAAWTLAGQIGAPRWADVNFASPTRDERLGAFAWRLTATPSASAEWREGDALAVSVEPGRVVEVAARITRLAAGPHRLSLGFAVPSAPGAGIEWRVRCVGQEGSGFAVTALPPPAEPITHQEIITIPEGCPFQAWSLWAEGADAQTASQATLSQLTVRGS